MLGQLYKTLVTQIETFINETRANSRDSIFQLIDEDLKIVKALEHYLFDFTRSASFEKIMQNQTSTVLDEILANSSLPDLTTDFAAIKHLLQRIKGLIPIAVKQEVVFTGGVFGLGASKTTQKTPLIIQNLIANLVSTLEGTVTTQESLYNERLKTDIQRKANEAEVATLKKEVQKLNETIMSMSMMQQGTAEDEQEMDTSDILGEEAATTRRPIKRTRPGSRVGRLNESMSSQAIERATNAMSNGAGLSAPANGNTSVNSSSTSSNKTPASQAQEAMQFLKPMSNQIEKLMGQYKQVAGNNAAAEALLASLIFQLAQIDAGDATKASFTKWVHEKTGALNNSNLAKEAAAASEFLKGYQPRTDLADVAKAYGRLYHYKHLPAPEGIDTINHFKDLYKKHSTSRPTKN